MSLLSLVAARTAQASQSGPANTSEFFDSFTYVGNESLNRTFTTTVNLTQGGMVWIKRRDANGNHFIMDTTRGAGRYQILNGGAVSEAIDAASILEFGNGFIRIGTTFNTSGATYMVYIFKEDPNFFKIISWIGNGSTSERLISHPLGKKPVFIVARPINQSSSTQWIATCKGIDGWYPQWGGIQEPRFVSNKPGQTPQAFSFGCGGGGGSAHFDGFDNDVSVNGGSGLNGGGGGGGAIVSASSNGGGGGDGFAVVRYISNSGIDTVERIVSGTTTWTVPTGVTSVKVWVIGAGGGGSRGQFGGISNNNGGRGGGAGAVVWKTYSVTPGQSISFTIGVGGVNVSNNGAAGGSTSATYAGVTITAGGGGGGTMSGAVGAGGVANLTNADGGVNGGSGGTGYYATINQYAVAKGGGGGAIGGVNGGTFAASGTTENTISQVNDGGTARDTTQNMGGLFEAMAILSVPNEFPLHTTNAMSAASNIVRTTGTHITIGANSSILNSSGFTYIAYLFSDANGVANAEIALNNTWLYNAGRVSLYTAESSDDGPMEFALARRVDTTTPTIVMSEKQGIGQIDLGTNIARNFSTSVLSQENTQNLFGTRTELKNKLSFIGSPAAIVRTFMFYIKNPLKTVTSASQAFDASAYTGSGTPTRHLFSTGPVTDLVILRRRDAAISGSFDVLTRRIAPASKEFMTANNNEAKSITPSDFRTTTNGTIISPFDGGNGVGVGNNFNSSAVPYIAYAFRELKGFFSPLHYGGTGLARTIAHNLNAVPEMIWFKVDTSQNWVFWHKDMDANAYLAVNNASSQFTTANILTSSPTATDLQIGNDARVNTSSIMSIALLWGSVPGITKAGFYIGTGNTIDVALDFATPPKLIMIRAVGAAVTSDFYVWDSARGISNFTGQEPHLRFNNSAAETMANSIDPWPTGPGGTWVMQIQPGAIVNSNGVKYVYYAIAS